MHFLTHIVPFLIDPKVHSQFHPRVVIYRKHTDIVALELISDMIRQVASFLLSRRFSNGIDLENDPDHGRFLDQQNSRNHNNSNGRAKFAVKIKRVIEV